MIVVSNTGTVVGKVNTTDKDQIGTDHVKIRYTLLTGTDMFAIHAETGVISTTNNTLDREVSTASASVKPVNFI